MFVCIKLFIMFSYCSFNICKICSDNFVITLVNSNLYSFSLVSENLVRHFIDLIKELALDTANFLY